MANNLNDIVTVNIDIASPAVDSASFDNLLIVGPPPLANLAQTLPEVGVYSDLQEVEDAGYVTTGVTSDPVGNAARIAFSQNPSPSKIFIAVQQEGDATTLEKAVETLKRALDITGWYVICPAGIPESEFEEIAEWTEAQRKMFAYTFMGKTDPVGSVYYRSHGWCGLVRDNDLTSAIPNANYYLHVGATTKSLSYAAGTETWAYKQLAGLYPSYLSGTLKKQLIDGNSNFFAEYSGKNITMNGKTRGGEWIDVIRSRDWLQNDMQLRIFNLLLMNPKIPYTNPGIALVENQMIASLKAATKRGVVASDEYDDDGAVNPGFTTSVPNSQSLTVTQKASRVLTDCKFSARLAGAIHAVRVNGTLTY